MTVSLSPQDAWTPLPQGEWNAAAAAHLFRRAAWTAKPDDVDRAVREGLPKTLDRLFPPTPELMPMPALVSRIQEEEPAYVQKIRDAQPVDRRILQREQRERAQSVMQNMTIKWLQYSAEYNHAAFQKWILFLSDVYVVSFEKVVNPPLIYDHFDIIGKHALGTAPELTKAISRSPAMVLFLDLNQNQPKAPNENFARELFELFVLGEGNYSEADIKEAAKAFTGYRTRPLVGDFSIAPRQHDNGPKTVFGQTGNYTGDEVIDLAYTLPAAGAFLPHEMVKFYLSDTMIPSDHLLQLGALWTQQGYDLRWLARTFFGSRIFYAPEFRGNFIKSPVQFYLGLVQDLNLDVTPVPRFVINPMRQMGQVLFVPPNVRGWVGGRNWINSGSLNARRAVVTTLFTPLDEDNMNADEQLEIVAARTQGADRFTVDPQQFKALADRPANETIDKMLKTFLAMPPSDDVRTGLDQLISSGAEGKPGQRIKQLTLATASLLQTPEYQLC
jgi:uncharacterized protein (DUF1800 family)